MAVETEQTADRDVERLIREIGRVIDGARPEQKEDLRQMAADLMRQEIEPAGATPNEQLAAASRPLSPLALGALLIILGAGFLLLLPPIGLVLFGAGVAVMVFGFLYRAVAK